MAEPKQFFRGEESRKLDERFRLSIRPEWADRLTDSESECILAKERPGCLSLWNPAEWNAKFEARVELIEQKFRLGELDRRIDQVQMFGRLLSTRQASVSFAGRGRVVVPDGFRPFLGVEPGGEVLIVGAAVCVEIWNPTAWVKYLDGRIAKFRRLFDHLSK